LVSQLQEGKHPGDKVPGVGCDTYKVHLKNPAAKRGKRGGLRVVYYIQTAAQIILLTIYSKSQQADISAVRVRRIIKEFEDSQ
jgi:mRNA-degrading endonuclease RelE of RelBE toxin-antitoxin system